MKKENKEHLKDIIKRAKRAREVYDKKNLIYDSLFWSEIIADLNYILKAE